MSDIPYIGAIERFSIRVFLVGREAFKAFWRYQGLHQAAALSYYAIFSFIPLLFLLLAITGMIWGDTQEVRSFLEEQLQQATPWLQEMVQKIISRFLESLPGVGLLSIGFIIWTSGLFFFTLQTNLFLPWTREQSLTKSWWRWLFPWIMGPVLSFFLMGSMLLIHLAGYVPWHKMPVGPGTGFWTWLVFSIFIFLMYRLLLPLLSKGLISFFVSLVIAGASQIITMLFTELLLKTPNYAFVYGSLTGIVVFLLWMNYNMALILWGGHFIRIWQLSDHLKKSPGGVGAPEEDVVSRASEISEDPEEAARVEEQIEL